MIAGGTEEGRLIAETASYLVVHKPAGIHSAPLREGEGGTLLDWCAARFPEVRSLRGRKAGEGGLLHRLDRGTSGLVLFARTQGALDALLLAQEEGRFIKRYRALSGLGGASVPLPGMPALPPFPEGSCPPFVESAFRPWGPGRRAVRPVLGEKAAGGRRYRTDILETEADGKRRRFRLEIRRGFRHQIRCHLAWLGFPLLGDGLYGGLVLPDQSFPALYAEEILFPDPLTAETRVYRCEEG